MTDWLVAGSALEALCWGVALFSSALLVVKLLFGSLFDVLDGHLDGSFDVFGHGDATPGGGFKAVLAGLMVTGWSGVLCFQLTRFSPATVLGTALLAGCITCLTTVWMLRQAHRIESDGTLQPANAVGRFGTVYLTIPAHGQGRGQIQIEVQGRLATLDAVTDGPAIPTGARVFVHGAGDGVLMVVPETLLNAPAALEPTSPYVEAASGRTTSAASHEELPHG